MKGSVVMSNYLNTTPLVLALPSVFADAQKFLVSYNALPDKEGER